MNPFKLKKDLFLFSAFFIVLLTSGFFITFKTLDPDFGWHIKTGQLILERGVPYKDWYSYTMPNFSWIDHEWLTDVLIYKIHSIFGFYFLLLIFLSIYIISLFLVKRKSQSFKVIFLPIILGYLATLSFLGIRPQLLTVFFLAVLYKLLQKFLENGSRLFYLIPFLFLVWVNLHAGFFAGLLILFIILVAEFFQKTKAWEKIKILNFIGKLNTKELSRSKIFQIFIILITSFLATFINPYGWRIYEEIFRTGGDNFLRFHIAEWLPLIFGGFNFNIFIYIYLGVFIAFLILFFKKIALNDLVISFLFLALTLLSVRYFLIFVILTLPILFDMVSYLIKEYNLFNAVKLLYFYNKIFVIVLFSIFLTFFSFGIYQFLRGSFLSNEYYPVKAISFLKTLPLSENMFNEYGWGGYLIWKLPEKKVFIDGRMPSWRQNGKFVFGDYIKITNTQKGFENLIKEYSISFFVLPKEKKDKQNYLGFNKVLNITKGNKYLADFLCFVLNCRQTNLYEELKNFGWQIFYEDEIAVVLRKTN